ARIQVEHPVSEETTGVDLIRLQLAVAAGEPLALTQDRIHCRGHAIEVRIIAEDPQRNFAPSPGRIRKWRPPAGRGVRLDSAMFEGALVPPFYDSMIAKLIVHGDNRAAAVARMRQALEDFQIEGIATNLPLLRTIVAHPDYMSNQIETRWLERVLLPSLGNIKGT
ncbi:MAG: acetyl-CoA carboxylase biotin carboxylase subunit, partial [Proteobacteria bacterium]|nr:acetyl-CoA carboxylase biotin carboxylase subunit [Pseudomonadota bacterium]